VFKKID